MDFMQPPEDSQSELKIINGCNFRMVVPDMLIIPNMFGELIAVIVRLKRKYPSPSFDLVGVGVNGVNFSIPTIDEMMQSLSVPLPKEHLNNVTPEEFANLYIFDKYIRNQSLLGRENLKKLESKWIKIHTALLSTELGVQMYKTFESERPPGVYTSPFTRMLESFIYLDISNQIAQASDPNFVKDKYFPTSAPIRNPWLKPDEIFNLTYRVQSNNLY